MSNFHPRRTVLYMPASNARALEKAKSLEADCLILDLEDAVAPDRKEEARAAAVEAVRAGGFGAREVAVRVNGLQTTWAPADLAALAGVPVAAIVVPKIESEEDVHRAVAAAGGKPLWLMIETPRAIQNIDGLASAAGVAALVAGFNDLAKDLGVRLAGTRLPLQYAMSRIVVAARRAGVPAFDGVYDDIHDLEGLERETLEARNFGFSGKTCIHPAQLAVVNRVFSPGVAEIAAAKGMVAAHEEALAKGLGVATYKGRMIENLHVAEARALLEVARALHLLEEEPR